MAERKDKTPPHGLGRWLDAAPPTATLEEVARAYHTYDDPRDVWPRDEEQSDISEWGSAE